MKKVRLLKSIPSTTGHVKSCGNQGRPFSKTKYYLITDSARVPRGKGEKNPGEGSEIESESVCLQEVEGLCQKLAFGMPDCVPFA